MQMGSVIEVTNISYVLQIGYDNNEDQQELCGVLNHYRGYSFDLSVRSEYANTNSMTNSVK